MSWSDGIADQPEWMERAQCRETDPEIFFPEVGQLPREAKLVCSRCEVRQECLDWAMARGERFGVLGGLSERERQKLRRRVAA